MSNSLYRLDIQGLRAISVLLVFISHSGVELFSGGYIGVDVFFVISGYVITQLIISEYRQNNCFQYILFYLKRLKRLLPALYLMVLLVLLITYWLLPLQVFAEQLGAASSSIVWVSNLFFLFNNQNYFSIIDEYGNYFLHTWSLGVEEQFYLIWPLIIVFLCLGGFRKHKFLLYLLLIAFISLTLSLFISTYSEVTSFYLMPTRIWQFSLGAISAYLVSFSHLTSQVKPFLKQVTSWLGIILIFSAAYFLDETTRYPYWFVLVPSIGTFLVLTYQSHQNSWLRQVLEWKPMVFIGDISYSFYLWHWPIILVVGVVEIGGPGGNPIISLILTLLISAMSYNLVEKPIRTHRFQSSLKKQMLTGIGLMTILFSIVVLLKKEVDEYIEYYLNDDFLKAIYDTPVIYKHECDTWYESSDLTPCYFGNKTSDKTVVLFGDSIVAQWFVLVSKKYTNKDWRILVMTKSACPVVAESFYYEKIKAEYKVCDDWRRNAIDYIKQIKPELIIMGSSLEYPFSEEQWKRGTRAVVNQFAEIPKVKLIAGTPGLGFNGPICLRNRLKTNKMCERKVTPSISVQWLSEVVKEYNHVTLSDLSQYICPNHLCRAQLDNQIVFSDSRHLTNTFVLNLFEKVEDLF